MTVDLSPQTIAKLKAAAQRNLKAGAWVAPDPMLDANDPPKPAPKKKVRLSKRKP